MLLNEFFSKPIDVNQKNKEDRNEKFDDDLFYFMIDHDKLHKDYFFPIAEKLKKKTGQCEDSEILEMFMPMVIKGCKEFYADRKMTGKLGKKFTKELREELCKRLYEHYKEGILKDQYRLG
jgi:hypothetical protein